LRGAADRFFGGLVDGFFRRLCPFVGAAPDCLSLKAEPGPGPRAPGRLASLRICVHAPTIPGNDTLTVLHSG